MSTNLIYNGDFLLPSITANTVLFYTSFTIAQTNSFFWTCTGSYAAVINGYIPANNIPDPSLIGYSQYGYIYTLSSIQQSFTVPFAGSYILSFYYVARGGYSFNNMQILINGVLFDTVTTSSSTWIRYFNTVYNVNIGNNTILFLGTIAGGAISLAGINFVFGQVGAATPAKIATSNTFKTTNIFGGLTVYDYVSTTTTPVQTISGLITTQQTYNYNYSVLPVYLSSSLGYMYSANNTASSVIANSFTNSSGFAIPIGVYIVDAYARFTPTAASIYSLKLGINTISGALTSLNYAIENVLVSSNAVTTINYTYYLSVATTTTYYFVFNTNTAGNLNQTLTGRFLRIA